jgi:hypothetical protein
MTTAAIERIQKDRRALALASALAVANEVAVAEGMALDESLITVNEETSAGGNLWRIHYGPRDYINQRGGDLIVLVDQQSGDVRDVLHGQ